MRAVYPRVCGGTCESAASSSALSGLSPRVRGNQQQQPVDGLVSGSIPACAGEPGRRPRRRGRSRVYPRVCGGTAPPACPSTPWCGLSPRVRGNPRGAGGSIGCQGSIPACAGEPPTVECSGRRTRVYPRVWGGTFWAAVCAAPWLGLSPRVRGNRLPASHAAVRSRSIPACAGEPRCATGCSPTSTVYPRVCGGTRRTPALARHARGLSPRVRGNPWRQAPRH